MAVFFQTDLEYGDFSNSNISQGSVVTF